MEISGWFVLRLPLVSQPAGYSRTITSVVALRDGGLEIWKTLVKQSL